MLVIFEPYSNQLLWILIVGLIVAFVLAFGIGANDVANSFGTSVGSKVLTLRQACILATIFEMLGSILIGAKVSDTIRKGIIDPSLFDNPKELMLGQVSSLIGCCIWLLVATFFNLPVSGTHSIVGATVGFALVTHGSRGIQWIEFAKIAGSWFASPALAGIISVAIFVLIRKFILDKEDQLKFGLRWLPFFYSVTIMINVFSILLSAPPLLYFDKIPLWGKFVTTIIVGLLIGLFVMFIVKPRLKNSIEVVLKKKHDLENRLDQSQLAKTDAVFGGENVKTCEKEIQVNDVIRSTESGQLVEIPRIRKDSETLSTPGVTTVSRIRRESDRMGTDNSSEDRVYAGGQRILSNQPPARKKTIIYHLLPNPATATAPGFIPTENNGLILATKFLSQDDNVSKVSDSQNNIGVSSETVDGNMPEKSEKNKKDDASNDSIEIAGIFKYLQILTAIFGAFAHGGNDVSNAIGPLIGLWLIYVDGKSVGASATPLWVLFYGGIGISVGLWVWGRRVIQTIGEDLTKITPSSGFVIEIATAFTVLVASNLSIPVSTTHCKVGSVVAIGRIRSKQSVDWSLFRNIFVAWIVTVPVTGGISAGVMALLRLIFL